MKKAFLFSLISLVVFTACTDNSKFFHVMGKLQNGDKQMLYLEQLSTDGVITIDSVQLKSDGGFHFKQPALTYPEFYFLKTKSNQTLPFAIDSNDVIQIYSNYANISEEAKISGSEAAQQINELNIATKKLRKNFKKYSAEYEKLSSNDAKKKYADTFAEEIQVFKDSIGNLIIKEPKSTFAYYALYQRISPDYILFNPYNENDYTYYAAVATSYNTYYEGSPRAKALYAKVLDALQEKRKAKLSELIQNAESTIPDIKLPNMEGDTIKLSDLKGKVVMLNFWSSKSKGSLQWNKVLKQVYNNYKNRNVEVYAVSLDKSKILWEEAIAQQNLNWINVCDFKGDRNIDRARYNVFEVPTTFIIDRNGDITARIRSKEHLIEELNATL